MLINLLLLLLLSMLNMLNMSQNVLDGVLRYGRGGGGVGGAEEWRVCLAERRQYVCRCLGVCVCVCRCVGMYLYL